MYSQPMTTWSSLMSIGTLESISKTGPLMEQDATERSSKKVFKIECKCAPRFMSYNLVKSAQTVMLEIL